MFRRCSKAFHNSYNCINHIGVIYSQYPFKETCSKKPASYRNQPVNLQCKSTDWFLHDTSPYQSLYGAGFLLQVSPKGYCL